MVYNNIDEIFAALATTRRRLLEQVEGVDDQKASIRLVPDKWSVAEFLEHLSTVEKRVLSLLKNLLAQAAAPLGENGAVPPVSIQVMTDRAHERFEAPPAIQPQGSAPLSESLAKLRESRAALLAMRPTLEAADYSNVTQPHPAFGPLNVYQWVAVVEFHECRHLMQMQALKGPAGLAAK
jgi:hypothetical protein